MAGPAGLNAPPIGVVIKNDDGSNSIWTGKAWAPAKQAAGGWGIDQEAMARLGQGGNGPGGVISPADQKTVADMQQQSTGMETLANLAADFIKRNARTKTGGVLAIPGVPTIMKAISGPSSDLAAMDRDSVGMATSLRAPGQRLTQMEFLKNLGSGPSVRNVADENYQGATQIFQGNTLAQAKTSFFASYLDHHRTLAGVTPAWLAFKNQHFDPTGEYHHDPVTDQQAAGAALKARSSKTGAPAMLKPSDYLGGGDD